MGFIKFVFGVCSAAVIAGCAGGSASNFSNSAAQYNIVGGEPTTTEDSFSRSVVQIFSVRYTHFLWVKTGIKEVSACTGTLISAQVILTAGHCTASDPNDIYVYFSNEVPDDSVAFIEKYTDYGNHKKEENSLLRQVSAGVVPQAFASWNSPSQKDAGDIALLKFSGDLPQNFQAIPLVPADKFLDNDSTLLFAGYGLINSVNQTSAVSLNKAESTVLDANFSSTEIMVNGTDGITCHGDSGGPGLVKIDSKYYVAAVVSRMDAWTDPHGQCLGKSIDTNVRSYLDWIAENQKSLETSDSFGQKLRLPSWIH